MKTITTFSSHYIIQAFIIKQQKYFDIWMIDFQCNTKKTSSKKFTRQKSPPFEWKMPLKKFSEGEYFPWKSKDLIWPLY